MYFAHVLGGLALVPSLVLPQFARSSGVVAGRSVSRFFITSPGGLLLDGAKIQPRLRGVNNKICGSAQKKWPGKTNNTVDKILAVLYLAPMNTHIQRAVRAFGSQKKLAAKCNVTQQAVSKWARGGKISAESARAIDDGTGGVVTVYELRPDIFGPAPQK